MQVLILSRSTIPTLGVEDHLRRLGAEPVRLEIDRFPAEIQLAILPDGRLHLREGDRLTELDRLRAAWYRRASWSSGLPADTDPSLRRGVEREVRSFVLGAIASRDCFVLDAKWQIDHAGRKPRQLSLAVACGLDVPRTLSTTDPAEVQALLARRLPLVTKVFTSFGLPQGGDTAVVFTSPVEPEDLEDLSGLELCPATFQERLDKEREYRVTLVGRSLHTISIDTRGVEGAEIDWRRKGEALRGRWKPDTLPDDAAQGLLRLMDRLGLHYGAADLIRTTDGRLVFLELNPAGEFLWADAVLDGAISRSIAELLLARGG